MNTNIQAIQLPLIEAGHHAHLFWITMSSYPAAASMQLCKYSVPNKSEASWLQQHRGNINVAHLESTEPPTSG